jgi:starch synthase
LVIDAIPKIIAESNANFIIIGAGHVYFEARLKQLNAKYPDRVFITIGYDEKKAHLLEAGSDVFLMPSRFEPCGLNQMYSLSYGTLPIVHRTGGLADTVIDAEILESGPGSSNNQSANGFVIDTPNTKKLIDAIHRALSLYKNKKKWQQLQRNAMSNDYSWEKSAESYIQLYRA